jgi:hypothetical protein
MSVALASTTASVETNTHQLHVISQALLCLVPLACPTSHFGIRQHPSPGPCPRVQWPSSERTTSFTRRLSTSVAY